MDIINTKPFFMCFRAPFRSSVATNWPIQYLLSIVRQAPSSGFFFASPVAIHSFHSAVHITSIMYSSYCPVMLLLMPHKFQTQRYVCIIHTTHHWHPKIVRIRKKPFFVLTRMPLMTGRLWWWNDDDGLIVAFLFPILFVSIEFIMRVCCPEWHYKCYSVAWPGQLDSTNMYWPSP